MNASLPVNPALAPKNTALAPKVRWSSSADESTVLTDIYKHEINIAIWQRTLSEDLSGAVEHLLMADPQFQVSEFIQPEDAHNALDGLFSKAMTDSTKQAALVADVANIIDMFCCLFELPKAGLRITALDKAMCPRFHVDRVPARLVTTYSGIATQWLPHQYVDRRMLGAGNRGLPDDESGLYLLDNDIHQMNAGDVALLKGELWEGNEQAGLFDTTPKATLVTYKSYRY